MTNLGVASGILKSKTPRLLNVGTPADPAYDIRYGDPFVPSQFGDLNFMMFTGNSISDTQGTPAIIAPPVGMSSSFDQGEILGWLEELKEN